MKKLEVQEMITKSEEGMKRFFRDVLAQAFSDFGREMRDFVRHEDMRLKKEIIDQISEAKKEIIEGVSEVIDHGIQPQIDSLDTRVTKLELKTSP